VAEEICRSDLGLRRQDLARRSAELPGRRTRQPAHVQQPAGDGKRARIQTQGTLHSSPPQTHCLQPRHADNQPHAAGKVPDSGDASGTSPLSAVSRQCWRPPAADRAGAEAGTGGTPASAQPCRPAPAPRRWRREHSRNKQGVETMPPPIPATGTKPPEPPLWWPNATEPRAWLCRRGRSSPRSPPSHPTRGAPPRSPVLLLSGTVHWPGEQGGGCQHGLLQRRWPCRRAVGMETEEPLRVTSGAHHDPTAQTLEVRSLL